MENCTNCTSEDVANSPLNLKEEFHLISLIFMCINLVVCVLTMTSSALVFATFAKFRSVRTIENLFLLNLSAADMLSGPSGVSANILNVFFLDSEHVRVPCLITAYFVSMGFICQAWGILLITIERWLSVHYPLRQILTGRSVALTVAVSWVVFAGLNAGCLVRDNWSPGTRCYTFRVYDMAVFVYYGPLFIGLPLLAMPVLYFLLTKYAFDHHKKIKTHAHSVADPVMVMRTSQVRTLKTLGLVLGTLYLSWLPTLGVLCMVSVRPQTAAGQIFLKIYNEFSTTLMFFGSTVNPLIYHRTSPTIRKAFRLLICPRSGREYYRKKAALDVFANHPAQNNTQSTRHDVTATSQEEEMAARAPEGEDNPAFEESE